MGIVCPTLPLSSSQRSRLTSSRLRRLRRSLPSISPSSGRPSRSWKRPRREPSLLPSSDRCPQSRQVQEGPAGAGRGRGESQACFPHLNTKHLSGQLKLEENLSVFNRNKLPLLPQSENTEVATR